MVEELPKSLHGVVSQFSARAAAGLREPVDAGAVPEVGAFDYDHHQVSLALDSVALGGLETLEPVRVSRSDGRAMLVASTSSASLRGTYRVAEMTVSQGALRMAATLTAGELAGAATPQSDTQLAAWFRDEELRKTENGRVLNGMYRAHEDTMNKVMVAPRSTVLRELLKRNDTKQTTDGARRSTYAHRQSKMFAGSGGAPDVPPFGDQTQVNNSTAVYKAMLDAVKREGGTAIDDPRNEYAALRNSMLHFNCAVQYVRRKHAGPLTPQQILDLVAKTPESEIPCGPAAAAASEGPDEVPLWPLDREYFLRVDAARSENDGPLAALPSASGTFADDAVGLELEMTLALNGRTVVLESVHPRVTMLRVRLDRTDSDLLARLDAFAGETAFYIDLIRTRIAAALGSDAFLARLTRTLS